jgi:DNA-directed RNA polymerase specialized sigma24 family protein
MTDDSIRNAGSFRSGRIVPGPWPPRQGLRSAVEELPAPQRTAALPAYFEGRTFRQVARLTGVPEGTAKSRLRLGLRRIADRLHSEGLDGEW